MMDERRIVNEMFAELDESWDLVLELMLFDAEVFGWKLSCLICFWVDLIVFGDSSRSISEEPWDSASDNVSENKLNCWILPTDFFRILTRSTFPLSKILLPFPGFPPVWYRKGVCALIRNLQGAVWRPCKSARGESCYDRASATYNSQWPAVKTMINSTASRSWLVVPTERNETYSRRVHRKIVLVYKPFLGHFSTNERSPTPLSSDIGFTSSKSQREVIVGTRTLSQFQWYPTYMFLITVADPELKFGGGKSLKFYNLLRLFHGG